jgi:hypothetical protein
LRRKTPAGIWALRGVTIAIVLVVIIVVGTVGYSAYEDVTGIRSEIGAGPQQASGRAVLVGSSEVISINVTVPNNGLYTLNITITCDPQNANVVCEPSHVSVPSGGQQVLRFKMTVVNLQQFEASSNHRINGTVDISLQPFASLSVGVDLGGYVQTGAG